MKPIISAIVLSLSFLAIAGCDQKPNPHVEWPPMPGDWGDGMARDSGAEVER